MSNAYKMFINDDDVNSLVEFLHRTGHGTRNHALHFFSDAWYFPDILMFLCNRKKGEKHVAFFNVHGRKLFFLRWMEQSRLGNWVPCSTID